ncbi:MAG: tetratricopeptide repeat protein [Myxococcota bacterium]
MEPNYEALERLFMQAVEAHQARQTELATRLFKEVLAVEPRFPEPRLELATLAVQAGDLEEAEAQAREAIEQLESGWKWLEDFSDEQLMAHACNLLGEVLKARSTSDDVLAQGEAEVRALWSEAGELFARAVELDPDNAEAAANYLGFRRNRVPSPASSRASSTVSVKPRRS